MSNMLKRGRDEDEEELEELRVDTKKLRTLPCLPFRTSPTSKHTLLFSQSPRPTPRLPLFTPAESSEDDDDSPSRSFSMSSRQKFSSRFDNNSFMQIDEDANSDFDMTDSQPFVSSAWTSPMTSPCSTGVGLGLGFHSRAAFKASQNTINGSRIPTPIYSHFNSLDMNTNLLKVPESGEMTSVQAQQEIDHDLFLRRRRLPSPISEDEAMESPTDMIGGMLDRPDMDDEQKNRPISAPNNIIPTKQQFARRGAVAGLGSKLAFSMGYRADCEKCRIRLPGHYSHVTKL